MKLAKRIWNWLFGPMELPSEPSGPDLDDMVWTGSAPANYVPPADEGRPRH
jgi:hypothetical protein